MGEKFVRSRRWYSYSSGWNIRGICQWIAGYEIENENVASDVAEQLSRINEQLAIKNRRSRRIWKIVAIILAVIVLVNIFIAVFFSVPDLNNNTQNNPLAISDETISIDEWSR